MTIYKVTMEDGETFRMEADLAQASAPLRANFSNSDSDWQITPYQTANARHNRFRAAKLIAEYFAGPDECTEVEDVEVDEES